MDDLLPPEACKSMAELRVQIDAICLTSAPMGPNSVIC